MTNQTGIFDPMVKIGADGSSAWSTMIENDYKANVLAGIAAKKKKATKPKKRRERPSPLGDISNLGEFDDMAEDLDELDDEILDLMLAQKPKQQKITGFFAPLPADKTRNETAI